MEFLYQIDVNVLKWLNSWVGASYFFDWVTVFRATYLWYIVMAAVTALAAASLLPRFRNFRRRNIELFIFSFASAFSARFIVTELIRWFYDRARPFEVLEGVKTLASHNGGGSFPSGHASLAFAVATAVSFFYPKISILFFLAALSIGAGRVAAGVHWPSDILGGAAVGIGTALLMRWLYRRIRKK